MRRVSLPFALSCLCCVCWTAFAQETEDSDGLFGAMDLPLWGLQRIEQRHLPLGDRKSEVSGAGVHVYVMDSGLDISHPEFSGSIGKGYDFVQGDSNPGPDCNGHGTHVSGVIGGHNMGVAPGVTLHPLRVFDCKHDPAPAMLKALAWLRQNLQKPAVLNISIAHYIAGLKPDDQPPAPLGDLEAAIKDLVIKQGVSVVVGAGNDARDACEYIPARIPEVLTVAASDAEDRVAVFPKGKGSNLGTCVDIFAPGKDIVSAASDPQAAWVFYRPRSGTSASAPFVSGVIAHYLSRYPKADTETVRRQVLENSTTDVLKGVPANTPNRLLYDWVK